MSGQTIVNAVNWSVIISFILWVGLWIAEQYWEARQRRQHDRRTTRVSYRP